MKLRAIRSLLLVLTVVVLLGVPSLQATPIVIDFGTGAAGPGGIVIVSGGNAAGGGIPLKVMTVTGTPSSDGVYAVDAALSFDTGILGNFISIDGTANGVGPANLLSAPF